MTDRVRALQAHKLSRREGITGPELAAKLGVKYAKDAWHLAAVGARLQRVENAKLSEPEVLLLKCLAHVERDLADRGEVRSATGKHVSWRARKADGWAASTAAKRLGTHRKGEDERWRGTGLNFVDASRNGSMSLTQAGWAIIHTMEANNA